MWAVASPFFLREREDTFRVFTYAPHDEKIRRLLAMGKSREEAEDLVENVDKERMAYIKHYFNAEWPTRSLYHLMINTVVGDENVIATILNGMRTLAAHPAETDPPRRSLKNVAQVRSGLFVRNAASYVIR